MTLKTDTGHLRNINWIFIAVLTVGILLAMWQIRTILLLAVGAVILTVFASIPVRFFVEKGINRGIAIMISMALGVVIVTVFVMLVFPMLFQQFSLLATDIIPRGIQRLIDEWNSGRLYEQVPVLEEILQDIEITSDVLNEIINQLSEALGRLGGSVLPLLSDVASTFLSILIVFFLCVYFIAEPDRYINGVIKITPVWYRGRMRDILGRLDFTIRSWIKITGLSMLTVGVLTSAGLALLGIQQWAALGVLAGVMSFIPNFGTIIVLIPSMAVAIIQAPGNIGLVFLVIYGVSFFQSQIVGPLLANESMNLAPVLVLIGQIVFGIFFGFMGVMLAVPLAAMLTVIIDEVYVHDVLGDDGEFKSRHDRKQQVYEEELMPSPD